MTPGDFLTPYKKFLSKAAFGTVVVLREQNSKYEKNIVRVTIMRISR